MTKFVPLLLGLACCLSCANQTQPPEPCAPASLILPYQNDGTQPAVYVCCSPGAGCVAMDNASDCPAGDVLYSCEEGESTTINGLPAVICHDDD